MDYGMGKAIEGLVIMAMIGGICIALFLFIGLPLFIWFLWNHLAIFWTW